jgi:hypothetical protein
MYRVSRLSFISVVLLFSTCVYPINEEKVIKIKKTNVEIIIDGFIDEVWGIADSITDFVQHSPFHGKEPFRRTVTKLLTSEEALYGLIICYDERSSIKTNAGTQDQFSGDMVSLMFDTFHDKRTAYKFAVSASGVKSDCRLIDDARNRDYSWDGIWFAESAVYDWGYVVEIKIPYKSIQYDAVVNSWGFDVDRWSPTRSEDIYWCAYEQNEGQRISKFGTLMFENFQPSVEGLNLEIYPVVLSKLSYIREKTYKNDPEAGIDIFFNPSQSLTFQFTANPDFAQIEADPFSFNISRYESYYSERRPFFTQGNEIFRPAGQERSSGFYSPLELFYSRRIGRILPDGNEVPLTFGTKASGRLGEWEYGGFLARTAETEYQLGDDRAVEPKAVFATARIKKQLFGTSNIGILFSGKQTKFNNFGVLDVDGAFRESNWQLAYQFARSFKNSDGDYAGSAGYRLINESWVVFMRSRYIGQEFDISEIGFVPWRGTANFTGLTGPVWYFKTGSISSMMLYGGSYLFYEKLDDYLDHEAVLGFNMQFRSNWGYEINLTYGKSKEVDLLFNSYSANLSTWINISPDWNVNVYTGQSQSYNFTRDYVAPYSWIGGRVSWKTFDILEIGSSFDTYFEGNPSGKIENTTFNSRPYFSLTPINYLNIRVYFDNLYTSSSGRFEQLITGLLFSYNFAPKSWIYMAVNELYDRHQESSSGFSRRLQLTDRAAVLKVKYLYYF